MRVLARRSADGRKSKTLSASKPFALKPPDPLIFFLDEAIAGKRLIEALREAGARFVPFFDEFPRGTQDRDWLPVVTERNWVLLTRDDRWRYHKEEMAILLRAKARAFVFVSKTATREEIAEIIVQCIPRMRKVIDATSPPFIAKIYLSENVEVVYSTKKRRRWEGRGNSGAAPMSFLSFTVEKRIERRFFANSGRAPRFPQ